jgi:hypothetical protein
MDDVNMDFSPQLSGSSGSRQPQGSQSAPRGPSQEKILGHERMGQLEGKPKETSLEGTAYCINIAGISQPV